VENTSYAYSLWAPEVHQIDGMWYFILYKPSTRLPETSPLIVASTGNEDNEQPSPEQDMYCDFTCPAVNHRMFALESSGPGIWDSEYTMKGELDTYNQFAIDGTYFQHSSGLYHIYSCWYDAYTSWPAMLCITKSEFRASHPFPPLPCKINHLHPPKCQTPGQSQAPSPLEP
jgi:hypothetical protein